MSDESSNQVRDDEKSEKGKEVNVETSSMISSSSNGVVSEIPTCHVCKKIFRSKMALQEHMTWRHTQTHLPYLQENLQSSSSSSVHGDHRYKTLPESSNKTGFEENGGSGDNEVVDESTLSAAYSLLLLATGDERYRTLPTSNKDGIGVSEASLQSNKKTRFDVNINGGSTSSGAAGKKKTRQNDKAVKRGGLNSSKASEKVSMEGPSKAIHGGKAVAASTLHICKECGFAYSSLPSLRGHMSRHKKRLPVHPAALSVDPAPVADPTGHICKECNAAFPSWPSLRSHVGHHKKNRPVHPAALVADPEEQAPDVRSFDLNEIPSYVKEVNINGGSSSAGVKHRDSEASRRNHGGKAVKVAGSSSHICKECNIAFPSGQSLGGHMRNHKRTPLLAAALAVDPSQVANGDGKKQSPGVERFDLNETPDASAG